MGSTNESFTRSLAISQILKFTRKIKALQTAVNSTNHDQNINNTKNRSDEYYENNQHPMSPQNNNDDDDVETESSSCHISEDNEVGNDGHDNVRYQSPKYDHYNPPDPTSSDSASESSSCHYSDDDKYGV